MRPLTVLSVGYPLAAVSHDSAGGAEQILATIDRALVAHRHRSIVVAPEGSTVSGILQGIPSAAGPFDEATKRIAQTETRQAIARVLDRERVDVVHLHGIDFWAYLPPAGLPVLATLHLPPEWYPDEALQPRRPDTWLHCVSAAQDAACPRSPNLLPPIPNGIPVEALQAKHARRRFALMLGRICPEKGVAEGIEAARRAGMRLVVAGQIYPYEAHQRYFAEAVRPHLGADCRFIGPVGFARKRRLLTAAQCLLIPSLAAETSSLVAREAAACGTPVVAFPNGALSETVEHGRTGFLVEGVEAMAEAIRRAGEIDPAVCREVALTRFSDRVMVERYLDLYARLAAGAGHAP